MKKNDEQPFGKLWELHPMWSQLTDAEKELLDKEVEIATYKRNEIIHSEGDEPTHVMMVVKGKVRIYKEGIGQKPQIIRILKPYDFFAYRAVIAGDKYNSCASAFEPCVIYKLKKEIFMELIRHNSHACFAVMEILSRDLAVSELQTVNLTQKHIRGRLAETLLNLKKNHGLEDDGATLGIYISREDIANMSNMTTSNAIRTLSQFASEGLITVDGRKIKLLNEEEIKRISRLG